MDFTALLDSIADEIARRVLPLLIASIPVPRPDLPLMLDADRLAVELCISETSVRALWSSRDLPSVKIGGLRRTPRADLFAYIASRPTGYENDAELQSAVAA